MTQAITDLKAEVKSSQQSAILHMVSMGWTYKMIAEKIGCSESYIKQAMSDAVDTCLPEWFSDGLSRLCSDHGYDLYAERRLGQGKVAIKLPAAETNGTTSDEVCESTSAVGSVWDSERKRNWLAVDVEANRGIEALLLAKAEARAKMGLPVVMPRFDVPVNQLAISFGDGQ